ncbi:N-acetylglucosamine-6-phosphate deacetylase [Pseudorhodobacter sp. W20_MBD10_FR17]|uniref:N-acetylglucosamine-6-phosphate deacetylase n=1 Tax=Pseudorhodobacter sp. W20_MBD10_FR17 TaxID=3240266 RepID=UPI003F9AD134
MRQVFTGARIFDGVQLLSDHGLIVENGQVTGIEKMAPTGTILKGGVLAPAFVDLQVNGGGGIMLDGQADAGRIAAICATHILLGCAGVLPTLITDSPAATRRVIAAGIEAAQANVPGFLGLHLEGPHLDPLRKGAHDAALIRPMDAADMDLLLEAAKALPVLMVTVAPASVTLEQVRKLADAGVIVSLGHAECSYDLACAYVAAGAKSATHLFNAMPPISAREPGLAGAVLDGTLAAGIIADGIHVSPPALRLAMGVRPQGLYLVSDCMAFAGTDLTEMELGGRRILRRDGRLTLENGTLAGADLRLDHAIRVMVEQAKISPSRALVMATSTPAALIGMQNTLGHLAPGRRADFVHLDDDWQLSQLWWAGVTL